MTEPLPEMRPRTVAGQRVAPMPIADGSIPRTRRQAFGTSFSHMNDFVLDRWRMLGDPSETINKEEFEEIVGEAPVEFFPGITRRQAETRAAEFEHAQFDSQFEQYPFVQFGGMAGPFIYDLGTVATLPLGAANIARMGAAQSARQFMLQGAIGAGKISVGATGAEVGLQVRQTGGVDPVVAGASAIAPFALVPAFGFLGQGLRALGRVRDGPLTNQVGRRQGGSVTPEQVSQISEIVGPARPPPVRILAGDIPAPTRRLQQMFSGYEGGRLQWLRDLSAGRDVAREFARQLNLDPDAPALRDLLIAMQDRSAATSRPPLEHTLRVMDALNLWRGGDRDPQVIGTLWQEGLLVARTDPTGVETVAPGMGRVVREGADPALELSETGRLIDAALRDPSVPANRTLLDGVTRNGVGELDLVAQRRGIDLDPDTNPQASFNRVAAAEVNDAEIIKALDAAILETADVRPSARPQRPVERTDGPPQGDTILRPDPDAQAQATKLRELGVDPDEIQNLGQRLIESITTCGARR